MKILLITQWYQPLNAASANRTTRFAEYLAKKHQITVLCAFPSYPTGVLPEEYRLKLYTRSLENEVDVLRVWDFPSPNRGLIRRTINHLIFTLAAGIAIMFMAPYDAVIVSSPNFFSGLAGILAARLWKSDFIFDIRDLWPDSVFALEYKFNFIIRSFLLGLEKYYYRRAKKILVVTPSIRDHLMSENIPLEKIILLPNSVDTKKFRPLTIKRQQYGFNPNDFIVVYTGNLGVAQGLETTIYAAKLLKKYSHIKFLLVGEGEEKNKLIHMAKNLKNVIFQSQCSQKEIIKIINFSDVGNISLHSNPIIHQAFPSKTLEYFACGKPVITSAGGYLTKLLHQYHAGLIYNSLKPQSMAKLILYLYHHKNLIQIMGQNSRIIAKVHFDNNRQLKKLDQIVNQKTKIIDKTF